MKHKYLHELYPNGNIQFPYNEEDYPDFDPRDTYNMDYTLIAWLYERLRYFQDHASKVVNFDFHTFEIDYENLTQRECIDRMVEDCAVILKTDLWGNEDFEKIDAAKEDLFKILSKVYWAMWW